MNADTDHTPSIAVDLDGTLAYYDHWRGIEHIGPPIIAMRDRVRQWLRDGKRVIIFTARITGEHEGKARAYIEQWLWQNDIGITEITNIKQPHMVQFWDDRAVAIRQNTGEFMLFPMVL